MPNDYSTELRLAQAQLDEMEKIAVFGALWRSPAWAGRLVGSGVGAATGAGAGVATAQRPEDRTGRAIGGALLGGLAGLAPAQFITRKGVGQASGFGQRQLHGLTGWLPGHGLKTKNLTPKARKDALEKMEWNIPTGRSAEEIQKDMIQWLPGKKFRAKRRAASEAHQQKLIDVGATSLPGLAKGYVLGPGKGMTRAQLLKSNILAPGVTLGVGLPAALTAPGVVESVKTKDPRHAVRSAVESAGYMVGGGLPLGAAAGVGTGVGALVGKVLPRAPQPQPAVGRVAPVR